MPVRTIGKSYRTVTGSYFSTKLGRPVQFESMLERDLILIADFHPAVCSFEEQPTRIHWMADLRQHSYVPDFRVELRPGDVFLGRRTHTDWLVEVKYWSDLRESWEDNRPKIKAGFRDCSLRGWSFHVLTDQHIRGPVLHNATFLRRFLNGSIDCEITTAVTDTVQELEVTTPADVVRVLRARFGTDETYRAIWAAAANRAVQFDFEKREVSAFALPEVRMGHSKSSS